MILYILITTAALLPAYYAQKHERSGKACLFTIFLVLAVPAVLRQETGNDYMRYVEVFHLVASRAVVPTEPGFNWLARLVYALCGYENYLLLFAIYAVLTVFFFLLAMKRLSPDFAFTLFVFLTSGYYFQSYNTVRYYFALSIVLFALYFFLRREYVWFLLLVGLAALFHKSALLVLAFYPLALHVFRKWQAVVPALFGAGMLLFKEPVMVLVRKLYPSYEGTEILAAGGRPSAGNILRCTLVLLLALGILVRTGKARETLESPAGTRGRARVFYINCTAMALLLYVFGWFIPELSRICYYLTMTQIFLLPDVLSLLPAESRQRKVLTGAVLAAGILVFAVFLKNAAAPDIRILPYRTFLFHEMSQTPSRSIR